MTLYRTRLPDGKWENASPWTSDPNEAAILAVKKIGSTPVDVAEQSAANRLPDGTPKAYITIQVSRVGT